MTKPKVVIVDYGVGNLLSVQRAVEECGSVAVTSSDPNVIARADRLILPGVGAFATGMKNLESFGLIDVIKKVAADGIPVLGICLGMQLLLDESEEYGPIKGLGIIPGRVVPVPNVGLDGLSLKIPHIGWNSIVIAGSTVLGGTILRNSTSGDAFYFLHSFMAEPDDNEMRVADCLYGGNRIAAVIGNKNIYGCQFHPEKSGRSGLGILSQFITQPGG